MCPSRRWSWSSRVDVPSSFINLVSVSSDLRSCPSLIKASQFMSILKSVRVVKKWFKISRKHGTTCNQCNKSGCMWEYFLREQLRFCSDISVNLC